MNIGIIQLIFIAIMFAAIGILATGNAQEVCETNGGKASCFQTLNR